MMFQKTVKAVQPQAIRVAGMATEKQLLEKMTSTKNIRKITSSMKMVAAAKLRGDQDRLAVGQPFGNWTKSLFGKAEQFEEVGECVDTATLVGKTMLVPITSDKGLCGGINSGIAKQVKLCANSLVAEGKEFEVFIVGEKGRPPLGNFPATKHQITCSINESWNVPTNFAQVSAIALQVTTTPGIDNYVFFYNTFQSVISYNVSAQTMSAVAYDPEAEEMDALLGAYETEPEDLVKSCRV